MLAHPSVGDVAHEPRVGRGLAHVGAVGVLHGHLRDQRESLHRPFDPSRHQAFRPVEGTDREGARKERHKTPLR